MAILDDTRADWNARPPLRPRTTVAWADRIGVSWHWIGPGKGPSGSGPHSACLAQVRDWQWQHQHKQPPDGPWKDIGYNALICQHARAIEGRGLEFSGSHSPGVNVSHIGIQFMVGSDTPGGATPAMFARAVRLRADIGRLGRNIRRDWRHCDDPKASTECCGPQVGAWVLAGGPTRTLATPTPAVPQEDEVTPQDIKAIADEVLLRPVYDSAGNMLTVGQAIGVTLRNSARAAVDATIARQLAEAQALKGEALTAAEVQAAAEKGAAEALDAKIADATTILGVKP